MKHSDTIDRVGIDEVQQANKDGTSSRLGEAVGHHISKKKKIFSRNARHASGGSTGHLCPRSTGHSPSPFPFFLHPLLLIQAVYSGGVVLELRALQQPALW